MRIADARRADGSSPAPTAAAALLVLLLAVLLSGCASTTEPQPTLTPTATDAAPLFASDEEALAAATEAYRAYLVVSDEVAQSGGDDANRFKMVASGAALENAFHGAEQYLSAQARSVGSSSFQVFKLQGVAIGKDGDTRVTMYICDDVTDVDLLGPDGVSIVGSDRPDKTPFQVTLAFNSVGESTLDEKSVWTGTNYC